MNFFAPEVETWIYDLDKTQPNHFQIKNQRDLVNSVFKANVC